MGAVRQLQRATRDPAAGGFYTVGEAARLLQIPSHQRITAWLQGHKKSAFGPVIKRQYSPINKVQELGFWDLLEVRFVEHFRTQGVSLQALRKAAQTAREILNQEHPFATSDAKFMTDRKNVFHSTAKEVGDRVLLNLVTRQYEMYATIEELLSRGISFDASGLAREWRPRLKEYPDVALNPLVAYGQPSIVPGNVPTEAIYKMWKAEDGRYKVVADWFEIEEQLARQAVEFELGFPN
jgi:uncharacterized protein (DUF433 family)